MNLKLYKNAMERIPARAWQIYCLIPNNTGHRSSKEIYRHWLGKTLTRPIQIMSWATFRRYIDLLRNWNLVTTRASKENALRQLKRIIKGFPLTEKHRSIIYYEAIKFDDHNLLSTPFWIPRLANEYSFSVPYPIPAPLRPEDYDEEDYNEPKNT
jgi:hypothetical protein